MTLGLLIFDGNLRLYIYDIFVHMMLLMFFIELPVYL